MEKEKRLFDVSLDSMLSTPIEVDASNDQGYPMELLEVSNPQDTEKENAEEKAQKEIEKDLIDLNEEGQEEEDEEEIEDIQEEPSSDKKPPLEKSKSKTSSPLTPYAKLLIDEGVLPNLDLQKFDGTADGLKEAMIEEIVTAVDTYKESLPDRIKHLINNYEDGIPLEKLLELDKSEVEIAKVDEDTLSEDTSLQKRIVTDYLKRTTKFSESKINKMVESYEDSGDLEDEAKSSLAELKTFVSTEKEKESQRVKQEKAAAEEQRKKDLVALQDKIKTTDEIIPGLKLNEKVKNNVFSSMTSAVGYDQTGRPVNRIVAARMENPVEFEMKLHYLFEITKGFKDFSKLVEKGKRDASKSFEEAVNELDRSSFSDASMETRKKSTDFIKSLEKTYKL